METNSGLDQAAAWNRQWNQGFSRCFPIKGGAVSGACGGDGRMPGVVPAAASCVRKAPPDAGPGTWPIPRHCGNQALSPGRKQADEPIGQPEGRARSFAPGPPRPAAEGSLRRRRPIRHPTPGPRQRAVAQQGLNSEDAKPRSSGAGINHGLQDATDK
jgi:hypothetical protein